MLKYTYNIQKADENIFISFQIVYKGILTIIAEKNIQEIQLRDRRITELKKERQEHSTSEYKIND